ncbi:stage III sporulation protein AF [Alkalihalobacillus sp. MEB130]|uniref:stage III sporulation protein AF n=1 Tax=Alkalihalobacillus sp. MEB130 TaxID=2976704 RepID=UPI0028E065EB|nr:stage III sporulation protein AF [Alkalihalobacillus sp. MEB130]MDT8862522.1 stage III sporulation protein AF [Alkalihalobacillus sp. MEB130]
MGFLTEWLTNIILLILLATILELMLPNSNMQRYVKMVVGLLLLVVMLQPLLTIFTEDVDEWLFALSEQTDQQEKSINETINLQKRDIESGVRAYTLEQVAVQLKRQVEGALKDQHSMEIKQVEIDLNGDLNQIIDEEQIVEQIHAIHVYVQSSSTPEEESENERSEDVSPVQVVHIDTSTPRTMDKGIEETNHDLKPVQSFLSENWQIPQDKILLAWEGGKQAQ